MTDRRHSLAARILTARSSAWRICSRADSGVLFAGGAVVWCVGRACGPGGFGRLMAAPLVQGAAVQFGRQRAVADPADEQEPENEFIRPDRDTQRHFEKARELLEKGPYGDALPLLDDILQSTEDSRVWPEPADQAAGGGDDGPADNSAKWRTRECDFVRGLKYGRGRIIGNLPPRDEDVRAALRRQERRMLTDALVRGRRGRHCRRSRRVFQHRGRLPGDAAAGASTTWITTGRWPRRFAFQRLRQPRPRPNGSRRCRCCWPHAGLAAVWRPMPSRHRGQFAATTPAEPGCSIAGKLVGLPADDSQAPAWLQVNVGPQRSAATRTGSWAMLHGNPARDALAPAAFHC